MNFLTLEVSDPQDSGGAITLCGGSLDGELFSSGSAVYVHGDEVTFQKRFKKHSPPPLQSRAQSDAQSHSPLTASPTSQEGVRYDSISVQGFWVLHRTIMRGFPAVICCFFNKRTQSIEQRYHKIFYKPGRYYCGPRFPRKVTA